ncbi:MAG: hypothetical protein OEY29_03440 [Gammaproteobacteria bacterium]|nr:hypothetical protein [Gammaproteobacteria bacterium]
MKTKLIIIIGILYSATSFSQNQNFWLIGGGNKLTNSQEQIEKNVIWLEQILHNKGYQNDYRLYYGIGEEPGDDTQYIDTSRPETNNLSALQMLYSKNAQTGISYRRHSIIKTDGGTEKTALLRSLAKDFESLPNDSDITLIYNGHGGHRYDNEKENYLKLWNDTKLSVSELSNILAKTPDNSTIRFILPQCYSGGFYNLIKPGIIAKNKKICGFMSVSETKEAEGCTLETNSEEFRDYTTYFFAALVNKDRNGENLISNPDLNSDNKVSYREAHIYTLKYAISKDISRSTSEAYLEKWLPWYLRWSAIVENTDSYYWTIAKEIALHNSLKTDTKDLNSKYSKLRASVNEQRYQTYRIEKKISQKQKEIIRNLKDMFPLINLTLLKKDPKKDIENALKINTYITSLPGYKQLSTYSEEYKQSRKYLIKQERSLAQINKVHRFKKLSWIEKMFLRYASSSEIAEYQSLLKCENSGSM